MKGKDAERIWHPGSRVLGHTVKSCMTVIESMGRYPKGIR